MTFSRRDWAESTIIDSEDLDQLFYKSTDDEKGNLLIHGYSVKVLKSGFNYSELEKYLGDTFEDYVIHSKEKKRLLDEGKSPTVRALRKASFSKDYQRDGNLGEFLLFLMTDGYFDVPMISHKIIHKQNYKHEVYGSDNLFFGYFKGEEHIGVGEAKIWGSLIDGVRSAVNSISDFHDEKSRRYMEQELSLAPKNISKNLRPEQIDYLADVMSEGGYVDYPLFHPIFVCYGNEDLKEVEDITKSVSEVEEEIDQILENEDYITRIDKQVENGHHRLRRAFLLFLILPVADLDEFRKRMITAIDPGLEYIFEDDEDVDETKPKPEAEP